MNLDERDCRFSQSVELRDFGSQYQVHHFYSAELTLQNDPNVHLNRLNRRLWDIMKGLGNLSTQQITTRQDTKQQKSMFCVAILIG